MDERETTTELKSATTLFTPGEKGEILIRDRQSSDRAQSWIERLIYFVVAVGPRFFELMSIVLLTSGINILTALLDANSQLWTRLISAACFILSGGLLFFFSAHIDRSYDDAKAQQRKQTEAKSPITQLAILATDIMTYDQKKLRSKFLTLSLAVLLFCCGLGTLVYGWAHPLAPAKEAQPNQPTATSPAIQAPSETDQDKKITAPDSENINKNSARKSSEKKTTAKKH